MKFKLVKQVEGSVRSYGGQEVSTGDEIELDGHFAEKAKLNPDYEEVKATAKKATAKK